MLKKILIITLILLIPIPVWAISFFIDPAYDIESRRQIEASLKKESKQAYFYVADEVWNRQHENYLKDLADEFDKTIYNKVREVFGEEWRPGIDNDPKIYVLITPMIEGAGGYFNPNDGFLKTEISTSNQREMIYLNSQHLTDGRTKAFLAHEFQHLINFYQKKKLRGLDEEVWLNEMLSEYAPTACGYDEPYQNSNLEQRVKNFLRDPSNSLTDWQNTTYDYSPINLFIQFLTERFGISILRKIVQSTQVGIRAIDDVLERQTFSNVFSNWAVANYLNDCQTGEKFCYLNPNLNFHISPSASYTLMPVSSLDIFSSTKEWSPHWYKFSGISAENKTLQLGFATEDPEVNFSVPFITIDKNGQAIVKELKGTTSISGFGKEINSVTLIPISDKISTFSISASVNESVPEQEKPNPVTREELITKIKEIKDLIAQLQKLLTLIQQIEAVQKRIVELKEK